MRFPTKTADKREQEELTDITQKNVKDCYQCMKCSSGCPLTDYMDYYPHQIMQRAKLGLFDEVLNSKTLWVCAACLACSSRCPRDLEPAKLMEGFRAMLLREPAHGKVEVLDTQEVPRQALIASMRKFRR